MCSWFSDETKTESTQSTQIPQNFQNLMDRTIAFANQGLDTPFTAYQGDRIAQLSNNEQMGTNLAANNAGMYQDLINMAAQSNASAMTKGGLPGAGDVEALINPYVNYVLGNSLNRLNEQGDINRTKIGSQAGMMGAFGSSRHGVLEGANLAELLKSTAELSSNTYSDAYDKAMGNWFKGQGLQSQNINDAMNIAGKGQAYNTQDIENLMTTGKVGRTRDQAQLDFGYAEFLRELADPYTKASFAGGVMSQYPTNLFTRNSETTQTTTPSILSSAIGLGTMAAGLMTGGAAPMAGMAAGAGALGTSTTGMAVQAAANADSMSSFNDYINRTYGKAKGGEVKRYAKGGKVKKFGGGGIIAPELMQKFRDRQDRNRGATTYAPVPVQQFDWDAFLQRHQMGPYRAAPQQVNNPNLQGVAPNMTSNRPDLSMFVQMLQQRLGNPNQGVQPINPNLPRPSVYKEGGSVRRKRPTADMFDQTLPSTLPNDPLYADAINGTKTEFDITSKLGDLEDINKTIEHQHEMDRLHAEMSRIAAEKANLRKRIMSNTLDSEHLPDVSLEPDLSTDQPWNPEDTIRYYKLMENMGPTVPMTKKEKAAWAARYGKAPGEVTKEFPIDPKILDAYQKGFKFSKGGKVDLIDYLVKYVNEHGPIPYDFEQKPKLRGTIVDDDLKNKGSKYRRGGQIKRFAEGGLTQGGQSFSRRNGDPLEKIPTEDPQVEAMLDSFIERGIDPEDVYTLAAQKWESGSGEYGKPNYNARPWADPDDPSKGTLSTAFGIGQWLLPSWNRMAADKKNKLPAWTQEQLDKGELPSKELQDRAWNVWQKIASKELGPVRDQPMYRFAWHQLGIKDLNRLVKADPNATVRDVLGEKVAKNVSAYRPKKGIDETAEQYFARLNSIYNAAYDWKRQQGKQEGKMVAMNDIPEDEKSAHTPVLYKKPIIKNSPTSTQDYGDLFGYRGRPKIDENWTPDFQDFMATHNAMTPEDKSGKMYRKAKSGHTPARDVTPNLPAKLLNDASDPLNINAAYDYIWGGMGFAEGGPVMRDKNGKVIKESKTREPSPLERLYDIFHENPNTGDAISRVLGLEGDFTGNSGKIPSHKVVMPIGNTTPPAQDMMGSLLQDPYGEDPVDNFWQSMNDQAVSYQPNTDNLLDALDTGDGSGGLTSTVAAGQAQNQDELSAMLKDYIKERLVNLRNTDENPSTDPLESVFGKYNKGLFRMGANILMQRRGNAFANIAGGVAQTQDEEEAAALKKIADKNARFKDLLNVRYLDAMTNQLSPETRKAIAAENNATELAKVRIQEMNKNARQAAGFEQQARQAGLRALLSDLQSGQPVDANTARGIREYLNDPNYPVTIDTSDIDEIN